eukprot:scaffold1651_cov317-Pinguiococcus_pyrenoidosus.AAC.17
MNRTTHCALDTWRQISLQLLLTGILYLDCVQFNSKEIGRIKFVHGSDADVAFLGRRRSNGRKHQSLRLHGSPPPPAPVRRSLLCQKGCRRHPVADIVAEFSRNWRSGSV